MRNTKPPSGLQIDWGHPLANGLLIACANTEKGGNAQSSVNPPVSLNLVNGAAWHGEGIQCTATDASANVTLTPATKPTWPLSICGKITVVGTPAANVTLFGGIYNSIFGDPFITWALTYQGGSAVYGLSYNDGVNLRTLLMSRGFIAGETVTLCGTIEPQTNPKRTYLNGLLDTVDTIINASTGPLYSSTSQLQMGETGAARNANIVVHYVYVWNRILSPYEALWMHEEPYAILKPIPTVRYVFLGLPTNPTPLLMGRMLLMNP